MTLYKHFRSKDELIMAALEVRRQRTAERMLEAEARLQPRAAILAVFDGLQEFLQDEAFRGCAFIHAAAEFHERSHPIHRQAAEQKASLKPISSASWSASARVRRHCLRGSCNT